MWKGLGLLGIIIKLGRLLLVTVQVRFKCSKITRGTRVGPIMEFILIIRDQLKILFFPLINLLFLPHVNLYDI